MSIQCSKAHRTNCPNSVDLICTKLVEVSLDFLLVRQSRQSCTMVVTGLLDTWTQSLGRNVWKYGTPETDIEVRCIDSVRKPSEHN